ncbi:MAG: arginine--tRNA ligase [Oscillospiraceae bacterium]|jgi:arginyl-tRNA synthetase|nr:arginine--tRNA ligase [Oscillospiraceae bacterium]
MSKLVNEVKSEIRTLLLEAVGRCVAEGELPVEPMSDFTIEAPSDVAHGDFAANLALVSAKTFRLPPRKIAELIFAQLALEESHFERVEVAGPGFINFYLGEKYFGDILKDILALGREYGRSDFGGGKRVLVEFVSANPTGPMHMGNARGGALGDCLAAVLDAAGYSVEREFYINDAGNQIEKFALSLDIRYQQLFKGEEAVPLPEECYQGGDIKDHAAEYAKLHGDALLKVSDEERRRLLAEYALPLNIAKMRRDIAKYRIEYDTWFPESILHGNGELEETIAILKEKGLTYEKDGALYYKASEYGCEKDEVIIRSNGNPTYFAVDIAYHRNKFIRGFERCINIWGADHHGHVARMKGAMDAIGLDGSRLDIILMQLVKLLYNGEPIRMSKRTGKAIQLADLLDEVPVDAARFLFNMREANSQMDFDLGLAIQQNSQNPVYYVQYAHARICSIIKALAAEGITLRTVTDAELALLTAPEERALIRHLAAYTDEIIAAAKSYDAANITHYVVDLATLFHKFYNACRVKGEDEALTQARFTLCMATKQVIFNVLEMLKVSAPESM